jgi:hypothetical protein
VKWEVYLNLVTEFLVDPHFVGKVEFAAATGATRFWNEGYSGRWHHTLVCLGGGKYSPHFSQRGLSRFY